MGQVLEPLSASDEPDPLPGAVGEGDWPGVWPALAPPDAWGEAPAVATLVLVEVDPGVRLPAMICWFVGPRSVISGSEASGGQSWPIAREAEPSLSARIISS